jgi:hypothetical protein
MLCRRWAVPALLLVLLVPNLALAHSMTVDCRIDGEQLEVRAGFGRTDSRPAANAKVRILNGTKTLVAEGVTDANGIWRTTVPPTGEYRVEVITDNDHEAEVQLTVSAQQSGRPTATSTGGAAQWWPVAVVFGLVALLIGLTLYRNRTSQPTAAP